MDLVELAYRLSRTFPTDERFGLSSQLRRAAVSVPSNIAEGQGRGSKAEFKRFLGIAAGSLCEVETQVLVAQRLGYISQSDADSALTLAAETGRIIRGLSNAQD